MLPFMANGVPVRDDGTPMSAAPAGGAGMAMTYGETGAAVGGEEEVWSEVELPAAAGAADTTAALAARILAHGGISLATAHVSGVNDQATARQNIEDTAAGHAAHRSSYGTAPGGTIPLHTRLLGGLLTLADEYSFTVSELAGGSHNGNSRHYVGVAADISVINGREVWRQPSRRCRLSDALPRSRRHRSARPRKAGSLDPHPYRLASPDLRDGRPGHCSSKKTQAGSRAGGRTEWHDGQQSSPRRRRRKQRKTGTRISVWSSRRSIGSRNRSVSATERLSEVAGRFSTQAAGSTVPSINIWEDDPFSEAVATATPSPGATLAVSGSTVSGSIGANPRLRTEIVEAKPAIGRYQPGTAEFRYWLVAESLARGIEFWDQRLPNGTTWSTSNPMRVRLVEAGTDLNARYMRASGTPFLSADRPWPGSLLRRDSRRGLPRIGARHPGCAQATIVQCGEHRGRRLPRILWRYERHPLRTSDSVAARQDHP